MKSRVTLPHINLSSYPGGGKTTLTEQLIDNYSVLIIPKFTTRPRRPVEKIPEYIFIEEKEFLCRKNAGQFIAIETICIYGKLYHTAIPKVEYWPKATENTELILSVFGINAPYVKRFVPDIKLFFIDFRNKNILMERLYSRCLLDNSDFEEKKRIIEKYIQGNITKDYDYIIYNDGTWEESLQQVLSLIKIPNQKIVAA
jgi:guanylate kinase